MKRFISIFGIALAALVLTFSCAKKAKEIKIGAILPLTGDVAIYGAMVKNGIDLAVDKANLQNVIPGRKIKIIYEDTQAKPELAVSAVNKLITIDKVPVIIGAMASSEVMAIAPIMNEKKTILVSPAATSHDITDAGDYIFRTIVSDIYDGIAMARHAFHEKKFRKVGVFYVIEAGPQGVAEAFIAEFKRLGGNITRVEKCSRGDKDFRTQIMNIDNSGPEALYFALYPRETEFLARQIRELGFDKFLMTHQLIDDPEVLSRLGKAANGIIFSTPKLTPETGDSVVKAFYKEYRERYNKEPQNFVPNAYDAVMIIAKAMARYGYDAEAVKKGLYEIKDYHDASGVISIDKNGDIEQEMLIMKIVDGKTLPVRE